MSLLSCKFTCPYLKSLLPQLLGSRCSTAADLHVSDMPLQLGPGPLTILKPALGIPQPQQLLLQQAVLSLQKSQLPNGWPCTGFPISTISPERAPYSSCSCFHGILWLQQQLQDGVLFDDCSLQDMRIQLQRFYRLNVDINYNTSLWFKNQIVSFFAKESIHQWIKIQLLH